MGQYCNENTFISSSSPIKIVPLFRLLLPLSKLPSLVQCPALLVLTVDFWEALPWLQWVPCMATDLTPLGTSDPVHCFSFLLPNFFSLFLPLVSGWVLFQVSWSFLHGSWAHPLLASFKLQPYPGSSLGLFSFSSTQCRDYVLYSKNKHKQTKT